mmetsp:Transcript_96613/g.312035  ORF Transcript_96613/g.312035 Transcript_96613/m.312035 type:complete len:334 (-) Transcript_96613:1093-2094(-)
MLCNGRPASSTAQSRTACSIQRATSRRWGLTACSPRSLSRISQALRKRKRKVRVEANSQKSGSGSKAELLKGCISRAMSRCVELHARATMMSRKSSRAITRTPGFDSARKLWRMQAVICASNCTSNSGQLLTSTWPCTSRVRRKRCTIKSISRSPAAARDSSSELEACAAKATSVSKCCTKRCWGTLGLERSPGLGISVWKCPASSGSACSSSSCTQPTAKTLLLLWGARCHLPSAPASFGPAMEAPSSCSSLAPSSPSGARAAASSFSASCLPFGGSASTISFRDWSHVGSCGKPRCRMSARTSSRSACDSGSWASSKSAKRWEGSCIMVPS